MIIFFPLFNSKSCFNHEETNKKFVIYFVKNKQFAILKKKRIDRQDTYVHILIIICSDSIAGSNLKTTKKILHLLVNGFYLKLFFIYAYIHTHRLLICKERWKIKYFKNYNSSWTKWKASYFSYNYIDDTTKKNTVYLFIKYNFK